MSDELTSTVVEKPVTETIVEIGKADWLQLERELAYAYGRVHLQCDGYRLTLAVQQHKMRLSICVYINGWIKGAWGLQDCEERRRFMCPKPIRFDAKYEAAMKKVLGRKYKAPERRFWYTHWWPSAKPLLRHLRKTNADIKLVKHEY